MNETDKKNGEEGKRSAEHDSDVNQRGPCPHPISRVPCPFTSSQSIQLKRDASNRNKDSESAGAEPKNQIDRGARSTPRQQVFCRSADTQLQWPDTVTIRPIFEYHMRGDRPDRFPREPLIRPRFFIGPPACVPVRHAAFLSLQPACSFCNARRFRLLLRVHRTESSRHGAISRFPVRRPGTKLSCSPVRLCFSSRFEEVRAEADGSARRSLELRCSRWEHWERRWARLIGVTNH